MSINNLEMDGWMDDLEMDGWIDDLEMDGSRTKIRTNPPREAEGS